MLNDGVKMSLKECIEFARENELESIVFEGVQYNIPKVKVIPHPLPELTEDEIKKMSQINALDQLNDDDILYWSVPYGVEIEAKRLGHLREDLANGKD